MKKVYLVSTKEYKAPKCKVVNVLTQGVLCQSFGNANNAGSDLSESDEYTYDL